MHHSSSSYVLHLAVEHISVSWTKKYFAIFRSSLIFFQNLQSDFIQRCMTLWFQFKVHLFGILLMLTYLCFLFLSLCRQLLLVSEILVLLGIVLSFQFTSSYTVPQYVCSALITFVAAEVLEGKYYAH